MSSSTTFNVRTLFHCGDAKEGPHVRKQFGVFGPGMYFAETIEEAVRNAQGICSAGEDSLIMKCDIALGKLKIVTREDNDDYDNLLWLGFESLCSLAHSEGGLTQARSYAVFQFPQVLQTVPVHYHPAASPWHDLVTSPSNLTLVDVLLRNLDIRLLQRRANALQQSKHNDLSKFDQLLKEIFHERNIEKLEGLEGGHPIAPLQDNSNNNNEADSDVMEVTPTPSSNSATPPPGCAPSFALKRTQVTYGDLPYPWACNDHTCGGLLLHPLDSHVPTVKCAKCRSEVKRPVASVHQSLTSYF